MTFVFREAAKSDAEILSKLHEECFPRYWNTEEFNNFFSVAGTRALIVEVTPSLTLPPQGGGKNKGMIVWRVQFEESEIITLAVSPAARRRGLADALVRKAMEEARAAGARKILLDVEDGNVAALKLYEKHGFAPVRRRKQYYRQKDGSFTDALVMVRKLG